MNFGNITGRHSHTDYEQLSAQGGEKAQVAGKVHKASGSPATSEIAKKAIDALKGAVSHLDISKHMQKLKGLSKAVSQLKSLILSKLSPKSETKTAEKHALPQAAPKTKEASLIDLDAAEPNPFMSNDLLKEDLQSEGSSHLLDAQMEPKILDLLGEARDLEHSISGWSDLNSMLERGSSLEKAESVSLDELLALLPDRTLSKKDTSRLNTDAKVAEMTSHIRENLLGSLRSSMGQEASPKRAATTDTPPLPGTGNPFATDLQRRASSLKFLSPGEMKIAREQMSERVDAAKQLRVEIKDTKQALQEASQQGVVSAKDAGHIIKGLDFIGGVIAKESTVARQLSQNLEDWTIPAHR